MVDDLESVKSRIASTLTAGGSTGYSIRDFDQFYQEDWFVPVPHEDFGFHSLVDFLKSIPDKASVTIGLNGVVTVRAVKTDETAKILSLVDRTERKPEKPKAAVKHIQSTPSTSRASPTPPKLTYQILLDLIKESRIIQVIDLKIKAKKQHNVDITLAELNKIFKCEAKTELEAYTIGLKGVVKVRPTKNDNGQLEYLNVLTKDELLAEIRRRKSARLGDIHRFYQDKNNGALLTTEVANRLLGTTAKSPLGALREAFSVDLCFDEPKDSSSEWDCLISLRKEYTIETLKHQITKFPVLFFNGHEKYAIAHYLNIKDLSLKTLNRVLGTSAITRADALMQALEGFADVKVVGKDIHITKIEKRASLNMPRPSAPPPSVPVSSANAPKREKFLKFLADLAPIYASNLWREYRRVYGEEPTTYSLNALLSVNALDRKMALVQACGADIHLDDDVVLNTYLIYYPCSTEPKRTNDFLRYKFVHVVYQCKSISLHNLCMKLKKQIKVDYNLETMNTMFGCQETNRKAIIEKYLSSVIRTEGKNDDSGVRLQLHFITKTLRNEPSSSSIQDDASSVSSMSTSASRRDYSPPRSSYRSLSPASSTTSLSTRSAPINGTMMNTITTRVPLLPTPKLPIAQAPVERILPQPQQSSKAPPRPAPPRLPPAVATVVPQSHVPVPLRRDFSCQAEVAKNSRLPEPDTLTDMAIVLAELLSDAGGIKLTATDAMKVFKVKYVHVWAYISFDATDAFYFISRIVEKSEGRLNLIYYNDLLFVKLAEPAVSWDPKIIERIQISPLCNDGIQVDR